MEAGDNDSPVGGVIEVLPEFYDGNWGNLCLTPCLRIGTTDVPGRYELSRHVDLTDFENVRE